MGWSGLKNWKQKLEGNIWREGRNERTEGQLGRQEEQMDSRDGQSDRMEGGTDLMGIWEELDGRKR